MREAPQGTANLHRLRSWWCWLSFLSILH